jgi:hypothetical protein
MFIPDVLNCIHQPTTNIEWLKLHSQKTAEDLHGKIIWKENDKIVASYPLENEYRKLLQHLSGEADRQEKFVCKPVDVIVNKIRNEIEIKLEVRNE